jgi:hypothetical protein
MSLREQRKTVLLVVFFHFISTERPTQECGTLEGGSISMLCSPARSWLAGTLFALKRYVDQFCLSSQPSDFCRGQGTIIDPNFVQGTEEVPHVTGTCGFMRATHTNSDVRVVYTSGYHRYREYLRCPLQRQRPIP